MSIYRRTFRYGGKTRKAKWLTAEFSYRGQTYRRGGFADRASAEFWIGTERMRLRRDAVGYVKPMHNVRVHPLILKYIDYLAGRGRDEMYVYTTERRLILMAAGCHWKTLGDITGESVLGWQSKPQFHKHGRKVVEIIAKTKNQYVQTANGFCKWLVQVPQKLLPVNPISGVPLLPAKVNQGYRRAGTIEEIEKLMASCSPDHRLFYHFEIYHPLRRGTVEQLTWDMLKLDANPPYGETPAEINKSGRDERFPVRFDVAAELRKEKKSRKAKAGDLVFPDCPTIDDLRADLSAAGVAFDDGHGQRRLDLHAMRKTLIRWCKMSGVSIDAASLLLQHKHTSTTQRHYDDDAVDPVMSDVLERLPAIGKVRVAQ